MIEKYPSELLQNAVEAIGSLPGVGSRSALRLALHLLKQPKENVHHFTQAIDRLADEVKYCRECRMLSDDDLCSICADTHRDHRIMQHLLEKHGFTYCGVIYLASGDERLAYQRIII